MSTRTLTPDEAESVANAIQLVREAGFEAKANLLDDMLEDGDIKAEPDMPPDTPGRRADWPWPFSDEIELNPDVVLGGQLPYDRCNPRIILLAGVLMHEANHVMGHGEIEAWGNTIVFFERLNAGFDGFFADCPKAIKDAAKKLKEIELAIARKKRKEHVRKAGAVAHAKVPKFLDVEGRSFASFGRLPIESRACRPLRPHPPGPQTPLQARLSRLARALLRFRQLSGGLPKGDNASAMRALRRAHLLDLPADAFNAKGEAIDLEGRPLRYEAPGQLHQNAFDLYSVDPKAIVAEREKRGRRVAEPRIPPGAVEIALLSDY